MFIECPPENLAILGIFLLIIWWILDKTPEKLVNPLKKIILIAALIAFLKPFHQLDYMIYNYFEGSTIASRIKNTFNKSDQWFEGFIDGLFFLCSATIYVLLLIRAFLSKKAKN